MAKNLKPKEKEFAKEYISNGGNATTAAEKVLGPAPKTEKTNRRGVQGHRMLKTIKENTNLLEKYLPDSLLFGKLEKLTNQKQLAYFVFSKRMEDEEIVSHMEANGLVTVVIRESDKGKLAFYTMDDPQAISKALDMGFKLKGKYAPEKKEISGALEIVDDPRLKELADKLRGTQ